MLCGTVKLKMWFYWNWSTEDWISYGQQLPSSKDKSCLWVWSVKTQVWNVIIFLFLEGSRRRNYNDVPLLSHLHMIAVKVSESLRRSACAITQQHLQNSPCSPFWLLNKKSWVRPFLWLSETDKHTQVGQKLFFPSSHKNLSLCTNECNTINALEKRLRKCACFYYNLEFFVSCLSVTADL